MMYGNIRKKISKVKLFDCKDLSKFISTIIGFLNLGGYSRSQFLLCDVEGIRFLTKLCFYYKNPPELYGTNNRKIIHQTDAEISILKLFKERIIDTNLTPCILELVHDQVCEDLSKMKISTSKCKKLMASSNTPSTYLEQMELRFCKYRQEIKEGLAHDKYAFMVLERCDMTLDTYLRKSINTSVSLAVFKSILFQIIYTIYIIEKVFPGFRHFDLHTDNVMLRFDQDYEFKMSDPKYLVFYVEGTQYTIPYFGIIAKIIDFGFSIVPSEGIYSSFVEDKANRFNRTDNDLLFLFHWIYATVSNISEDKVSRVDKILSALEPKKTYIQHNTGYINEIKDSLPTYKHMLTNNIFAEYTNFKVDRKRIYKEYNNLG